MKRRDYLNENLKKLLGLAKPEQSLPADKKKEILENLLRNADTKDDAEKSPSISFKFKVAAAIAAVVVLICSVWLLNKPAGNNNITAQEKKQQVIDSDEIKTNAKDEIALIDIEKLAAAGDVNGLIAAVRNGSSESKIAAANYLAKMGAVGAVEALKEEANNWQQSGENPFTEAIKKIQAAQNTKQAIAVKESNEPNNISKIIKSSDPNDLNNQPSIEIWVVDKQTDEPIKDARVRVNTYSSGEKPVTDQNGYCKATTGKESSEYFSVYVEKEGYVPMFFNWGKQANRVIPQEYTFYLEKGKVIGGTVKNDQNEPVKDAEVKLSIYTPEEDKMTEPWQRLEDFSVKTDINGKWQCDMIPAELTEEQQISIRIKHADYAEFQTWALQSNPSQFQMLQNREFVTVLKKGVTIYGYIKDNQNRPIEKVPVFIGEDRYNNENLKTNTDKNGYFEFVHTKQGFNVLTVLAEGFAPDMRELNVYENSHAEDFVLAPGNKLYGRVVDVNSNPVEGAEVIADEWRKYRMVGTKIKTDKDGRFAWNDAPADEVKFNIFKQGYMVAALTLTPKEQEYKIILSPPLVIYGNILNAETNEPIKESKITPGMIWRPDEQLVWQNHPSWIKYFKDGKYEFQLTTPAQGYALKLDANDGRHAESRIFESNEGKVRYDFLVGKANTSSLAGIVYNPDGKPAEGAIVYLANKNQWLNLENGKQRYQQNSEKAVADSQGKFTLPDCNEKFILAAVSDAGVADVNSSEFAQEPAIHLEKWGRIEGVVYIGSKLAANQEIMANNSEKSNNRDNINYQYSNRTTTDQQGKFVMEKVVPGQNHIYRIIRTDDSEFRRSANAAGQAIEVLPGQTAEAVLGGKGRAIIGKIIWPSEDFYKKMLEINSYLQPQQMANQRELMEKAYSQAGEIPKPTDFDTLSAKQAVEWYKNWSQSDDGKAYYAKIRESMEKAGTKIRGSNSGVIVDSNGSFRTEDIEEGDYIMNVTVMERKGRYGQVDYQNPLLTGKFNFTVPQIDQSNIDQPLDLGQVTLEIISAGRSLQADSNAPDFTLETTTAGTVKLADLRGKFVVLVFWNCSGVLSSADYEAKMDSIFDAYKKYGSTGNVEFIAVSMSVKYVKLSREIAEKYLKEKSCNWKQAFVDYGENTIFTAYKKIVYSPTTVVLIGPDGRIVASEIDGQQLIDMLKKSN